MSLHVSVIGIDGSGKSTLAASLPMLLAAEYNIMAGGAGETYVVNGPEEDHLCDEFTPDGLPLTAGIATMLKKLAKRFTNHRRIYPLFKMPQMMAQDSAARRMERKWALDCVVSDGNTILSTMGRAANYLYPASTGVKSIPPSPEDLAAVLEYVLKGKELNKEQKTRLPSLRAGRCLRLISNALGLKSVWLPDVVILLKLDPEVALERIHSRGQQVDRHENAQDLAQTHRRYHTALETVRHIKGDGSVIIIDVSDKNPRETLRVAVAALKSNVLNEKAQRDKEQPLGTTKTKLTEGGIWSKVFSPRYLLGYFFPYFFRGAWREPMFPFSKAGQRFLKEGYSAGVMKEIYDHDPRTSGLSGRIFQNYPLHRAVYDRLQLLARNVELELELRLRSRGRVALFTAPSGFAYDVFGPLENIAKRNPELMDKVDLLAIDLDPHGVLAPELKARSAKLGINFKFRQGDLTEVEFRNKCATEGPFDLALFVGLSSWFPKPSTLSHLRWLSQNLDPDGRLITDCFTPSGYSLSGRYVGYRAHYYSPQRYRMLLEAAGFDGFEAQVEAGRDSINHVVLVKAHKEQCIKRAVQTNQKLSTRITRSVVSFRKHHRLVPA